MTAKALLLSFAIWSLSLTYAFGQQLGVGIGRILDQNGVSVTARIQDCEDATNGTAKQYVLLKLTNERNEPMHIRFRKELWYGSQCSNCEPNNPESIVSLTLAAQSSVQGSCADTDRQLRIFSKMLRIKNVRKLKRYQLKDIEITPTDEH